MQESLILPRDIEIKKYLGKGGRANVYKAILDGNSVIVKIYRNEVAEKYLNKYKVDIAQYEYDRNTALYNLPQIAEFIAKPYRVYTLLSEYSHSIVQEYVSGVILENLIKELEYLPKETLEAGYKIVKEAERNGIHDLDISVGNVKVDKTEKGWMPKLYDFNIMPQYLFPPNNFVKMAYKMGFRKKSFRDYRSLRNWKRRGDKCIWIGRN